MSRVGTVLAGRYTLLAKIGAGSMGTVYRARQHAMGRDVAVKILRSDRASDESAQARFALEARANSVLTSPNTVTVFDFGQNDSGEFFLAMELLDGESLGERLQRLGHLSPIAAVDVACQALRSLAEAHAKGIVHRDLKPDNLFFSRVLTSSTGTPIARAAATCHDEIVKVLDFGVAKMMGKSDPVPMSVIETQAGTVFGTPRYMSPEQAQGKPLDARSDLYSLSVIVYHMLCGRPPFNDSDAVVVMARHIKAIPIAPSEANPRAKIPPALEAVVMRALSKDPDRRPASADAFATELNAALDIFAEQSTGVRRIVPAGPSSLGRAGDTPLIPGAPFAVSPSDDSLALALRPRRPRAIMALVFAAIALAAMVTAYTARQSEPAPEFAAPTTPIGPADTLAQQPATQAREAAAPAAVSESRTPVGASGSPGNASRSKRDSSAPARPKRLSPNSRTPSANAPAGSSTARPSESSYGIFE